MNSQVKETLAEMGRLLDEIDKQADEMHAKLTALTRVSLTQVERLMTSAGVDAGLVRQQIDRAGSFEESMHAGFGKLTAERDLLDSQVRAMLAELEATERDRARRLAARSF